MNTKSGNGECIGGIDPGAAQVECVQSSLLYNGVLIVHKRRRTPEGGATDLEPPWLLIDFHLNLYHVCVKDRFESGVLSVSSDL
jgi:hypothetical protein